MSATPQNQTTIPTIGHSNHTLDTILALLAGNQVKSIINVRSVLYIRLPSHYSSPALA